MGSCYVAQDGLELMGTGGAGRTLGGYDAATYDAAEMVLL